MMSSEIQVPGPSRRGAAQLRMTSSKALSKRTCQRPPSAMLRVTRFKALCRLLLTLKLAVGSTMRGSVLHHRMGWPSENQGKMPRW